ncbi:putative protein arginine N-methyltransferase 1 [Vitis vinifera]|uniref:Retrovirus-related Pol polyprotein from transposon RE1 n=1 Tax=Vitis vinifera TaxID=29760 RepID=A0A438J098_VITVI|nr:putative protein arginine N-methyltransferase 1 [Vitis vinifera]
MAVNPITRPRSKHIAIDYHFVRELVANGTLKVAFIPSHLQLADSLTKGVTKPQFFLFRHKLSVIPSPTLTLQGGIRKNHLILHKICYIPIRSKQRVPGKSSPRTCLKSVYDFDMSCIERQVMMKPLVDRVDQNQTVTNCRLLERMGISEMTLIEMVWTNLQLAIIGCLSFSIMEFCNDNDIQLIALHGSHGHLGDSRLMKFQLQ